MAGILATLLMAQRLCEPHQEMDLSLCLCPVCRALGLRRARHGIILCGRASPGPPGSTRPFPDTTPGLTNQGLLGTAGTWRQLVAGTLEES